MNNVTTTEIPRARNSCPVCGDQFPALDPGIHDRLLALPAASAAEVMTLALDVIAVSLPTLDPTSRAYVTEPGFDPDLLHVLSLHDPDGSRFDSPVGAFAEFLGETLRDAVVARRFVTAVWELDNQSRDLVPRKVSR